VYYLRIVATMYSPLDQASVKALPPASVAGSLALVVLTLLLLRFGVVPQPLCNC
jgi:NADH:ubiquinone oxidoreductase subunit 2 (subunit N)